MSMRRPQFSLATLGGMVACSSIACAALVYASETWSTVLFTSAILFLTVAILLIIYRAGSARAFWVGCAVFGWTYLLLHFWLGRSLDADLATSQLAKWAYWHILPEVRTPPAPQDVPRLPGGGGGGNFFPQFGGGGTSKLPPPADYPEEATFVRVAHAVWTWFFLLVGGVLGRYLYATRPS
jgi:hypothetical protein